MPLSVRRCQTLEAGRFWASPFSRPAQRAFCASSLSSQHHAQPATAFSVTLPASFRTPLKEPACTAHFTRLFPPAPPSAFSGVVCAVPVRRWPLLLPPSSNRG